MRMEHLQNKSKCLFCKVILYFTLYFIEYLRPQIIILGWKLETLIIDYWITFCLLFVVCLGGCLWLNSSSELLPASVMLCQECQIGSSYSHCRHAVQLSILPEWERLQPGLLVFIECSLKEAKIWKNFETKWGSTII